MQISSAVFKVAGVVAIIVFGGLIYLSSPSSALPPEKVLSSAFKNLEAARSFRTSADVRVFLNYDTIFAKNPHTRAYAAFLPFQSSSSPFAFSIEGVYDVADKENPAFDQTMTFRLSQEDQKIEGAIQMIAKDDIQYIQLAKAPLWGFINFQPFARTWVKIDEKGLRAKAGQLGGETLPASSSTADQLKKFQEIFGSRELVKVSRTLREEAIGGVLSYHYEVKLHAENLLKAVEEYIEETAGEEEPWGEEEDRTKVLSLLEGVQGELWVDKAELYPRKLVISVPFKDGKDDYGKMTAEIAWNDFNEPVNIAAPASPVPLEEFVQSIFGVPPPGTPRVKQGGI